MGCVQSEEERQMQNMLNDLERMEGQMHAQLKDLQK